SHIEKLLADVPRNAVMVTVIDGHPVTLAWLGGVHGHRTVPLGVEHFGQTGTIGELYRHFGIDSAGIVEKVDQLMTGRPLPLAKV
ncbi:transketolase, partial [Sulfitobacter sp. F26204]|nr:transketolase [Sulfitobacter sp. F26204]